MDQVKYKFVPDANVEMDWKFEGLQWELNRLGGEFYMDGGQFSIPVDLEGRSLSSRPNRQGVFVELNQ